MTSVDCNGTPHPAAIASNGTKTNIRPSFCGHSIVYPRRIHASVQLSASCIVARLLFYTFFSLCAYSLYLGWFHSHFLLVSIVYSQPAEWPEYSLYDQPWSVIPPPDIVNQTTLNQMVNRAAALNETNKRFANNNEPVSHYKWILRVLLHAFYCFNLVSTVKLTGFMVLFACCLPACCNPLNCWKYLILLCLFYRPEQLPATNSRFTWLLLLSRPELTNAMCCIWVSGL